ncbi:MAG: multicomponent Na+:H+ antiporter subunit [Anaerophaga sp.]|uniref:monovalent cation/H(+) antiporter subunit G n=1 Tax=Anaerophaga thermohalophila TaxID=177400 RepID=UPI000237CA79|nr:monovalent cation/H(+) antiporter subunit G [Anaerophaga thermohalophila]MDK2841900.1 multicomponent Na+:H+ antiporter subunit [Anaerophaga sp.]
MTDIIDIIAGIIMLFSSLVVLIASIGIWRFKNLYARMHVVTKVSSLGLLLLLIGVNLLFRDWFVLFESAIIFGVLVFLSPVAAHVIARAARSIGIPGTTDEAE